MLQIESFGRPIRSLHNLGYRLKYQAFLKRLKMHAIPKKKLQKKIASYEKNPEKLLKELYTIQKVLDDSLSKEKAEYVAMIYLALLSETIDFEKFKELCEVVRRLFMNDIPVLRDIYKKEIDNTSACEPHQVDRLNSLGLLETGRAGLFPGGDGFSPTKRNVWTSSLGNTFCQICLEGNYAKTRQAKSEPHLN